MKQLVRDVQAVMKALANVTARIEKLQKKVNQLGKAPLKKSVAAKKAPTKKAPAKKAAKMTDFDQIIGLVGLLISPFIIMTIKVKYPTKELIKIH